MGISYPDPRRTEGSLGVGVVFAYCKNHAKRAYEINAQVHWGKCGRLGIYMI